MNRTKLNKILAAHDEWVASNGASGARADLAGADLADANLMCANLMYANLQNALLRDVNLRGANLQGVELQGANLTHAALTEAILVDANLTGAYVADANFACADLTGADLTGANLFNANLDSANLDGTNLQATDLRGCIGNRKHIKSMFVASEYPITYTADVLQIGCEQYLISEWAQFDGNDIFRMDGNRGLNFWRMWKDYIFMTIEKSPAEPTGHGEK